MSHKHNYWLDPEYTETWWMAFWCEGCRTYAYVHRPQWKSLMKGLRVVTSATSPYWSTAEVKMATR